ncbi:hypothetical protein [Salinicoccus albus]|nr:hypothetical protein [Salinicoccus albus]
MKRLLYKILKYSNDAKAVKNNRIGQRAGRRIFGKISGKIARSIFK